MARTIKDERQIVMSLPPGRRERLRRAWNTPVWPSYFHSVRPTIAEGSFSGRRFVIETDPAGWRGLDALDTDLPATITEGTTNNG